MLFLFVVIVALLLAIFVVTRRRRKSALSALTISQGGYAIPPTAKMVEAERQDHDEVTKLLEASIRASGLFRTEAIPGLVSKLRGGWEPFARVSTRAAFEGDEILSVEEKRALGLNTRMKYSKALIDCFDPRCLSTIEPKSVLEDMHLNAFHRVARKRDLLEIRELGVKQVRIVPLGGRDCAKIRRLKKIHDIDELPELPLPGCTAPYCLCMYEAIIPK
ncbi:MAG TPA: hypothetical protein VN893_25320 [Bryobacteraceae bacterium]|nr:hypothetical protein [Bryobacteraceae bacterium]